MRKSAEYLIEDVKVFRRKLLAFLDKFDTSCLLTSNEFYASRELEDKPYYHDYELLAGFGLANIIEADAGSALAGLQNLHDGCKDWLLGYLSYDLKNEVERLESKHPDHIELADMMFFQPETVIYVQDNILTISCLESDPNEVYQQILRVMSPETEVKSALIHLQSRFSKAEYLEVVEKLKEHIKEGDVYEISFCQEFFAENADLAPLPLFERLMEISPNPFACFLKHNGRYVLSSSMERFLKKKGDTLISQPIKGTIRKSADPEEDAELQLQLLNDEKERAENVMIVDLVRNDLAWSAKTGTVKVEELFGIYPFTQVHQMISTVTAEIKEGIPFTEILRHSFPMGSMTGAPKIKAMELIEKYERSRRGVYSGSIGYISPERDFDFNVIIRTFIYNSITKYLSLQVGSAITYDSVPEKEYEECLVKISGMKRALGNL